MKKARKKIAHLKNIIVIGITGSYGKTSTKEFIAHILSKKFRVIKTLASQNTDIGIAERILQTDLSQCEIFVVEMAAYHPGEITSSCSLFNNNIKVAVITGINEQHQSLFGSIETTMQSKYELVKALSEKGYALFNGENERTRQMSAWKSDKKIISIIVNKTHMHDIPKSIHGSHFRENLSLAFACAEAVGMNRYDINKALVDISLPPRTMDVVKSKSLTLINDTFNANPDAVYAALDYIKHIPGKKVLILQPLIELGNYADNVHEKIGKIASELCDYILLTNKNFNTPFFHGASQVPGGISKIQVGGISPHVRQGVVLFEGKEAEKYIHYYRIN